MNLTDTPAGELTPLALPYPGSRLPKRDFVSLASDLLPPLDFGCFLLAGFIGSLLYTLFVPGAPLDSAVAVSRGNVALIGAVLAPFVLYDRNFAAAVGRRHTVSLIGPFGLRFVLIAVIAVAIGGASQVFDK